MGLLELFKRNKAQTDATFDWPEMGNKLSQTLWQLVQTDRDRVESPDAAVVLGGDGNIRIASQGREPPQPDDVGIVSLRQDRAAHEEWIDDLRSYETETFRQNATEDFARRLADLLAANAGRANVKPVMAPMLDLPDGIAIAGNEL